jgi:outer membrane protein OmpU
MNLKLPALWLGILLAAAADGARAADDTGDILPAEPLDFMTGDIDLSIGGFAGGALGDSWQSGGPSDPGGYDRFVTSGELRSWLRAERTLDNGIVFGLRTDLLLLHDDLSGDIYGSDTLERLFGFVQTGFGRFEIGEVDGAAYSLALTGPEIDPQISLEQRTISLFRDPGTGRDFAGFFKQVTAVQSSSNYAKINFLSPRLVGLQIGASLTPETVRTPLPLTGNPRMNAQHDIWEVALNYTDYISDVAVGLSAGYAEGIPRQPIALGQNLYDWSVGAEFAYDLDDTKLTVGGAWRGTNAWLLNVYDVLPGSATEGDHFSTTVERGPWRLGAETSNAHATGPVDYDITGYQLSAGYLFTPAIELSGGWQWYHYARNSGTFYNGLPKIRMDAVYVGLSYRL